MTSLPVDAVLPELLETLQNHSGAVLHAPPGAGKTTRVPLSLLNAAWFTGNILMLEPRRLAAVNAARWMASLLGEEAGQTVGYAIRYERRISVATRIEVVTEGILTRRLQNDPLLEGVSLIIFDEFHERSLNSDLSLALCRDVQTGLRDDLKLLVMSATLDCEPVARLLGNVPVISSPGRSFPVEIHYLDRDPVGRIPEITATAIERAVIESRGDILAFLPGYGEINRCRRVLTEHLRGSDLLIYPLHANLTFREQEQAILPAARRKVVLATTIAETSLTIQGVSVVVDAGWSRQPRFDASVGIPRLETVRVSQAAADQRAGRSGRQSPGVCYRLWTRHVQRHLVPFSLPEITVTDLAPLALELAHWGINDPLTLSWLDPPPEGALTEARRLLVHLGALDSRWNITPRGRRMASVGLHPRLARLLLAGEAAGCADAAATLCALLSERDIFRHLPHGGKRPRSDNDLMDRYEAFCVPNRLSQGRNGEETDTGAAAQVERLARQLRRSLGRATHQRTLDSELAARLLLVAWPDRIASQREPGSDRYLLANGRGGQLSERSALHNELFLAAIDIESGESGEGRIHSAVKVSPTMIREELGELVTKERQVEWLDKEQRVLAREVEKIGAVLLSSRQVAATDDEIIPALMQGVIRRGVERLPWPNGALQLRKRVVFCSRLFPEAGLPDLSNTGLTESPETWLAPWLTGCRSLADIGRVDLLSALRGILTREQLRLVEEAAPTHLTVPSGSRIVVQYDGDVPVLAVKLQELFGLAETPTVAKGRQPILLHLLSPAGRPIQVTHDLNSFWNGTYREVKKELKGRYPKHPWPDDPWSTPPTRRAKPRGT